LSIQESIEFLDGSENHYKRMMESRYLDGLARAMEKRGAQLYELTRAMNFQGNQVITADGIVVTAGAVVMATNSPLNHNLAIHARQTPDHSYVVGLKLPKGSVR
jgi:glycine/D-amino acid oxidase-like deaminating enzyme